jgi:hypothetical protein
LVGGYLYFDRTCWNTACEKREARISALEAEKATAIRRASDLALLYAKTAEDADAAARVARNARAEQGRQLNQRAASLDRAPAIHLSAGAVGLLIDASKFANGITAPAEVAGPRPDPVPESADSSEAEIAAKWTAAAEAYADAKALAKETRDFYNGVRNAKIGEHGTSNTVPP